MTRPSQTELEAATLEDPRLFINRELSWLEFNRRVLAEAQREQTPLLERAKFLAIFSSNLDEFFMVRVAGLKEIMQANLNTLKADGLGAWEVLQRIAVTAHQLVEQQYACLREEIMPQLKQEGIVILRVADLPEARRKDAQQYYMENIAPVLTPLALDPSHPFPHLANGRLNLALVFEPPEGEQVGPHEASFGLIQVPAVLPRLIPVKSHNYSQAYVLLGDMIASFCAHLFAGLRVRSAGLFRVTRNTELRLNDEDIEDLLQTIDRELRQRHRRRAVRLEVEHSMDATTRALLMEALGVTAEDVYAIDGPLDLTCLWTIYKDTHRRYLKDPPFNPRLNPDLATGADIFSVMREQDILLHHPYESFSSVVEFLQTAAEDPDVLAIKQTLYRTAGDSSIVQALIKGANSGKQVTVLVELRARFDELNNIQWARQLENEGVHVVYGLIGLKTHCKAALVVRRDPDKVRRYVHLGTGNYNSRTADLYTDLGLLTCDPVIAEDVSTLFNLLTGFSYATGASILSGQNTAMSFERLLVAPITLHQQIQRFIEREIEHARAGRPARIIAKMNALVDPATIRNLYRASCAGVRVDLIIRGVCCLRPGVPGVSENIQVISIVDRFLEHARVFHFENGGQQDLYIGSADWMPRNFFSRVEAVFPILHPRHKARIRDMLDLQLADTAKAHLALPTGAYAPRQPPEGQKPLRSQEQLIDHTRRVAIQSPPYQETLKNPRKARLTKIKKSPKSQSK
jgi:polyphosphate kinase